MTRHDEGPLHHVIVRIGNVDITRTQRAFSPAVAAMRVQNHFERFVTTVKVLASWPVEAEWWLTDEEKETRQQQREWWERQMEYGGWGYF